MYEGSSSDVWLRLQKDLSSISTVCVYDRFVLNIAKYSQKSMTGSIVMCIQLVPYCCAFISFRIRIWQSVRKAN